MLRDCVSVLVDLCIQIQRLEKFFTMLTTIIDSVVLSRADTFTKEMGKFGKRALEDRAIEITDVVKQTIYMSTLQLKAYFSLLADISEMYLLVDRKYILPGKELCLKLSKGSEKNSMPELQEELSKYTSESAQAVAKLVEEVGFRPLDADVRCTRCNAKTLCRSRPRYSTASRRAPRWRPRVPASSRIPLRERGCRSTAVPRRRLRRVRS